MNYTQLVELIHYYKQLAFRRNMREYIKDYNTDDQYNYADMI